MRQLNLGSKSVEEKLAEMKKESAPEPIALSGEITQNVDRSPIEAEQAMKKYNLVKSQKGLRVNIDEDVHEDFKILAIRLRKTQDEILQGLILDFVRKEKKKFEK